MKSYMNRSLDDAAANVRVAKNLIIQASEKLRCFQVELPGDWADYVATLPQPLQIVTNNDGTEITVTSSRSVFTTLGSDGKSVIIR